MNFVEVVVRSNRACPVRLRNPAVVDYVRAIFADGPAPRPDRGRCRPCDRSSARKYRQQLFPGTPLLFAAVDERFLRDSPVDANETAVASANDFPGLIDDILQVLPQTRQVFMVLGSGQVGQFWRPQLEGEFEQFHEQALVHLVQRPVPSGDPASRREPPTQLGDRVRHLEYGRARRDVRGRARVRRPARRGECSPLFARMSPFFGRGIVGGRLLPIDTLSRSVAAVAARILNGAPPGSIQTPPERSGPPTFDWRELQRWDIPESRLPAGSVVRYRPPSLCRNNTGSSRSAGSARWSSNRF